MCCPSGGGQYVPLSQLCEAHEAHETLRSVAGLVGFLCLGRGFFSDAVAAFDRVGYTIPIPREEHLYLRW